MEEKKKSGKGGLVVIIVLLLLICCGMGAFIFMNKDKIFTKEATTNGTSKVIDTEGKKTDLELDSPIVINLFEKFRLDKGCYTNVKDLNGKNVTRLRVAADNIGVNGQSYISCAKVGGMIDGRYCGSDAFSDKEMSDAYVLDDKTKFTKLVEERMNTTTIDQSILKAKYLELFGSDADYKDEDFGTGHTAEPKCGMMHYDKDKKLYAAYNGECGGTCAPSSQKVTKAYKDGNIIIIETEFSSEVNNIKDKVTYEFKFDEKVGTYVYFKATEE